MRSDHDLFVDIFKRHTAVMLLIDPGDGRIIDANLAAQRFYGYTRAELTSLTIQQINQLSPAEVDAAMEEARQEDRNYFVFPHRLANGEVRTVEVHSTPVVRDSGNVLFSIIHDITAREQADRALRAKTAFLNRVIESSSLSMWIADQHGTAIQANQACYELFGATEEEVIGKYNILRDEVVEKAGLMPTVARVFSEGIPADIEIDYDFAAVEHVEVKGATHKVLRSILTPVLDDAGSVAHVIAQAVDVTRQRESEAKLRQAQKMEAIGMMAGGIAHDFNNILSVILSGAEAASLELAELDGSSEQLEQIMRAGWRGAELVRNILSFSRSSGIEDVHVGFDPTAVVEEVLQFQRSVIPATIRIASKIARPCGWMYGNAAQLHQLLMNFCTNAYHAMEERGGVLEVTLSNQTLTVLDCPTQPRARPGDYVALSVRDTGVGMMPEVKERIFDPYFTTKDGGRGSGMGLSVVQNIMRGHDGFLTVESTPGQGSVFTAFFPRGEVEPGPAPEQAQETLPTGVERVLLVDDEEMLVRSMDIMLSTLGYEVTAVHSSQEALSHFLAAPQTFDLLITDQTMPEMSGGELATRCLEVRPDLPIILATGYSSVIDSSLAKALGIREFVLKPIGMRDLAMVVRRALGEG